MNVKNITLKWHKPCELEDLDNFFKKEGKGLGGLYLWIFKGKPERIWYIGEAQNFKARFKKHLEYVTHGLYTAVKCATDEDLCDKYKEISENSDKAEQEGCFYKPKNDNFKRETLQEYVDRDAREKYVEKAKKGIQLNLDIFLNCYFVFVETKCTDASRQEVESIFMHKRKVEYLEHIKKKYRRDCEINQAFLGTVSKKHDENCQYIFTNTFSDPDTRLKIKKILKDIGIELKGKGDVWTFPEEAE